MDDLTGKLNELLSNPDIMRQIQGLSGMLGSPAPQAPPEPERREFSSAPEFPSDMMQMVSKMMPLISSINQEDDSTRFLRSLKPLLGDTRRKRLEEAIRMMQMLRFLPLLKKQDLF